ncbi:hypothetical protein [uncultured Helicobacter sp.]|nr:hypothetical protein [uncultured Helicobacter sp.]
MYYIDFKAHFGAIPSFLLWIESRLKPYVTCVDSFELVLCESLHNIIEHHIIRIDKMHLFTRDKAPSYITHKQFFISCTLYIRATHILIIFSYPFKPCYHFVKTPIQRVIGGRGKRIMRFYKAQWRTKIHHSKSMAEVKIRFPLEKPGLISYKEALL